MTTTIGDSSFFNEVCYTGGIYDVSTGLYYLNARYYDPNNGRFVTQDTYRGELNKPNTQHMYVYCANNPINYVDPSGHWIETAIDVASTGYSLATFMKKPSWLNAGYLLWDVGATFIPFLPGSYVKKSGKIVVKVADKASDFRSKRKGLTIGKYKSLRKIKYSKKVEIHHIIEKRFKKLRLNERDYPSVPLTPELHRKITKRWRKVVPYGINYRKITKDQLIRYCRIVYNDMPELRKVAIDSIIKYYKK